MMKKFDPFYWARDSNDINEGMAIGLASFVFYLMMATGDTIAKYLTGSYIVSENVYDGLLWIIGLGVFGGVVKNLGGKVVAKPKENADQNNVS